MSEQRSDNYDPNGAAAAVQTDLNAHKTNTDKHITNEERSAWNTASSKITEMDSVNNADWLLIQVTTVDANPQVDISNTVGRLFKSVISSTDIPTIIIPPTQCIYCEKKLELTVSPEVTVSSISFKIGALIITIAKDNPAGWPVTLLTFWHDGDGMRVKKETCLDHVINYTV